MIFLVFLSSLLKGTNNAHNVNQHMFIIKPRDTDKKLFQYEKV